MIDELCVYPSRDIETIYIDMFIINCIALAKDREKKC